MEQDSSVNEEIQVNSAPVDLMDDSDLRVGEVDVEFVTGAAGTGKTYQLKKLIEEDRSAGLLCATTGVAAVNLSTTTINSVLGYFDTDSLADAYAHGKLVRKIMNVARQYKRLMIDEISMLEATQLDIITQAVMDANARDGANQLGITLTGDFAQLAPVKGKWAFEASSWPRYAEKTRRLTKIWRQDNEEFLAALNLARAGKGIEAAEALRSLAKWSAGIDTNFDGTTIVAKNDEVERINTLRYMQLKGKEKRFRSARWGVQRGEWKNIPEFIQLKIGALVMILTNGKEAGRLLYANGDQGYVEEFSEAGVFVRLKRNDEVYLVPFTARQAETKEKPDEEAQFDQLTGEITTGFKRNPDGSQPYYDEERQRYVLGGITYLPLRLAYATTVHKSQGLTLDAVQIDPRGHFFGSPNMAYVALSRVKTPQGLKIVGTPEMLARRIKIAPEVLPWV